MRLVRSQLNLLFSLSLLFFGLSVFQNCSDVEIESIDYPVLINRIDSGATYTMCPHTELKPPQNTKFIFALDMSVSNIGGWIHQINGSYRYSYWDRTKNTDIEGLRFDAVKAFLDGCGLQAGNEFLAIGFSHNAGTIVGVGKKSLSCNTHFGSASTAKNSIDQLKQAQLDERPWYEQWEQTHLTSSSWPGVLGATSYNSALNCIDTVMTREFSSSSHIGTDNYHIFMVSDGTPNDGHQKGCNTKPKEEREACYLQGVDETTSYIMQMGIARQKVMRLHGISYENEARGAKKFLDLISANGNTGSAVELDGFENFADALCESIISQAAIDYQPDFAAAVNLSVLRRNGILQADSDMDGLTDKEEGNLGYDPLKARSAGVDGVLDGICKKLGGKVQCQERRDAVTCDSSRFNSMGLSECDIKILGLNQEGEMKEWGLDSDDDGMPDLVEILKGTDPLIKDMSFDPDSDGQSTRSEILLGRDPFEVDGEIPDNELSQFEVKYEGKVEDEPSCQFGAWKLSLKNSPVIEVKAYSETGRENFSHDKNVQKIFVFYRLDAQNTLSEKSEYFGAFQRVAVTVVLKEKPLSNGFKQEVREESFKYLDGERILSEQFQSLGKVSR